MQDELEAVFRLYLGLAHAAGQDSLGGKLLYAGVPDAAGCRLLRAANIAGAASLASSADAALLRDALRAGAVDFAVNSLDEALRILKNEIRKQQPVAVGVSIAPENLLREMDARGVQPDLLAPELPEAREIHAFVAKGARRVDAQAPLPGTRFTILPIPPDWKQPAGAFDALLLACLSLEDVIHRRWVQLAPRYLSREGRQLRSLACDLDALRRLRTRISEATSTARPDR